MLSYGGIGTGNPGFEYRCFVWTGNAAPLGDELVVRRTRVDMSESLFVWSQGIGSLCEISMQCARFSERIHLGGTASQQISSHQRKVGEQLSDFGVGEDKGQNRSEVLYGWKALENYSCLA